MKSLILLLLFGVLLSLAMEEPRRVATTLLRDARSFIGEFELDGLDAAIGPHTRSPSAEAVGRGSDGADEPTAAFPLAASVEFPASREHGAAGAEGAKKPAPGAGAPRAGSLLPAAVQRQSGAAPSPSAAEPIEAQIVTLAQTLGLPAPAHERSDEGLPEILLPAGRNSGADADERSWRIAAAHAIELYREARDILWNLN